MNSNDLDELVNRADALTFDEKLYLIAHLSEKVREAYQVSRPRRQWREICGSVSHPLLGEDAQAWVSQMRREDNEYSGQ